MNLGSLNVKIGVDQSGLTAGLNQAKGQVQSFAATAGGLGQTLGSVTAGSNQAGRALSQGVGAALSGLGVSGGAATRSLGLVTQGLGSLGAAGTTAGISLGVGLVAALVAMGAASVRASVEFNEAMANVATLIPGNIERVKELKGVVQNLAVATGTSTGEISGALFDTISAWGDSAEAAEKLNIAVKAGIASGTDAREAVQLLAGVTKAYGDESAAATQHVADLAFKIDSLGLTTVKQLIPALTKVAPLAHQAGISMEELSAVMATATGTTGNAARVSTQFQGVTQALLNPTKAMTALFKAAGVESGEALIKQKGFAGAVQLVVESAKASDIPLAKFITRIEGQRLAYHLAGEGADKLTENMGKMKDVAGSMGKAFKEHDEGINQVGQDWKKLKEAIVVGSQEIGDAITSAFGHRSVTALTSFVTWLTKAGKAYAEWSKPGRAVQAGADWMTRRQELGEAGGKEFGDKGLRAFMLGDLAPLPASPTAAGSGVKGLKLPDPALTKALNTEQTRYTNELAGATERLSVLLAGEGNIAGQVAARYHLLTEAQRDNLTAVLKQIEHQTQLNAVQAHTESNSRVRALLARGESVEVAKLGGQYSQLSTTELRAALASEKATEAAIQASTSRKAYAKDLGTLNEEIRRLAAGHKAEGGAIQQLAEKYPGLSRGMLQAMENARQWKLHLEGVRAEAHRVADALRGMTKGYLDATAQSRVERAAVSLFGDKELEKNPKIPDARSLYRGLNRQQQFQAQGAAVTLGQTDLEGSIERMKERLASLSYASRTNQISMDIFGKSADHLSQKNLGLVQSYERLENAIQQVDAAAGMRAQEQQQYNALIGTAGIQAQQLGERFEALTGKSVASREVMERFGVVLKDLPKATQATVRGILELQHRMDFFKEFAQGTQQVFEQMFTNLYQHGFKNFFGSVIQGFSQMLQQMAARYLASRLTDLVTGLIGNVFGAAAGAGGGGGAAEPSALAPMAGGGMVQAAQRYMVGEQGPELFVPRSDGRIVPHGELAGAGAGGSINITMHVSGVSDAESFRKNSGAIIGDLHRRLESRRRRDG